LVPTFGSKTKSGTRILSKVNPPWNCNNFVKLLPYLSKVQCPNNP